MASDMPTTKSYARIPDVFELPNLIEVQAESFQRLKIEGLADLFRRNLSNRVLQQGNEIVFPRPDPRSTAVGAEVLVW